MTTILAFVFALAPTYLVRFSIFNVPTTLFELAIYAAAFAGAVVFARDAVVRVRLRQRLYWLWPAVFLFVGATVSLFYAPDLRTALGLWKGFIVDPIILYVLLLSFAEGARATEQLVGGYVAGACVVAFWACLEGLMSGGSRVLGPYALDGSASPNYLAFALAPGIPLVLSLAYARRSGWLYVLSALLTLSVVFSLSRAGVAGLAVGVLVAIAFGASQLNRLPWVRKALLMVIAFGLVVSWVAVRPDFSLSGAGGGRTVTSNNVRWQLWGVTAELAAAHPLRGVGLGGFQEAFAAKTAGWVNFPEFITPLARTPHNLFVTLWMETTALGLAAGFIALTLAGRALFRALQSSKTQVIAAGFLGAWATLLVQGLLDTPIWKNDGMAFFWLLVAVPAILEGRKK